MSNPPPPLFPTESAPLGAPDADAMNRSVFDSAQVLALSTVQAMQALTAMQPPSERATWRKLLKKQQEVLRFLQQAAGDEPESEAGALSLEQRQELARMIRQRRDEAKLTQEALAKLAGLSRGTIRAIEASEYNPTRTTLLHLLSVKELSLTAADLPLLTDRRLDARTAPSWYQAPTYEPLRLFLDLVGHLNGSGGHLEQTYAYIDPMSAANWYALCNQEKYDATYRRTMPFDKLARKLVEQTGRAGLDVIGLGCGDGKSEVRLVQHLIGEQSQPDLRLYLLDISHYLLSAAYRHAEDTLIGQRGTAVFAIQGNFFHLPRYTQLHYRPERSHRRRVVCLLGSTFCNMDNEVQFLRHSLVGFAPGDYLILNERRAYGSLEDPQEIRRKDPTLQNPIPTTHAEWLGGPIRRYCAEVADVQFAASLNTSCPIPGSYAIEVMAHVRHNGKQEKRFSVFRFKRYDMARLKACLKELGWDLVSEHAYGGEQPHQMMLLLFRKTAEPSS